MRHRRFSTLSVLSLLAPLVVTAPRSALAQPISAAEKAKARDLANAGYDALDKRDYVTAANRFTQADGIIHVATVRLGLARAQAGLGHLVDAETTYKKILTEGAPPSAPPVILKAIAEARREADALASQIPVLLLRVTGAGDAPVRITVDGAVIGRDGSGSIPVDPGSHVVRAVAPGRRPAEATFAVAEGQHEGVELELLPEVAAPTPVAPVHTAWPARKTAGVVLMASSAVGAAVGGALAAVAHGKYETLASACPGHVCNRNEAGTLDSYHALGNGSLAGFIAGGALLGTGIILYASAPTTDGETTTDARNGLLVTPVVGAGWAGVTGTFR